MKLRVLFEKSLPTAQSTCSILGRFPFLWSDEGPGYTLYPIHMVKNVPDAPRGVSHVISSVWSGVSTLTNFQYTNLQSLRSAIPFRSLSDPFLVDSWFLAPEFIHSPLPKVPIILPDGDLEVPYMSRDLPSAPYYVRIGPSVISEPSRNVKYCLSQFETFEIFPLYCIPSQEMPNLCIIIPFLSP